MTEFMRVWEMPNSQTFKLRTVGKLLEELVGDGTGWADPFAGFNSPAEFTNDLNPEAPTREHKDAKEFVMSVRVPYGLNGVLFDPPYSPRQIAECYKNFGSRPNFNYTQGTFYSVIKTILAEKVRVGGTAICFGWNSNGFGINRGFRLLRVILIAHGGNHNDTIVTVEEKDRTEIQEDLAQVGAANMGEMA